MSRTADADMEIRELISKGLTALEAATIQAGRHPEWHVSVDDLAASYAHFPAGSTWEEQEEVHRAQEARRDGKPARLAPRNCVWCAKPQPANDATVLAGIATRDDDVNWWDVRRATEDGLDGRTWLLDEPGELTPGATVVADDDTALLLDDPQDDDWGTVLIEVGAQLADAREAAAAALAAALLAARHGVKAGLSEAEAARFLQVDRMTVRRALGKR